MPGKYPQRPELKCRVCGGWCVQDRDEGWIHEDPPDLDDPHLPEVYPVLRPDEEETPS
jgi:hypothetical protein